jgi:tripartite-type tricarboxylate transporter receptor subunit TctC
MRRRQFLRIASAAASASLLARVGPAKAQSFAGKQIRVIVPFPAGGPTDIVARPLAQMLGDALKATVVIDNRGGAGGSLGAEAVARSAISRPSPWWRWLRWQLSCIRRSR